MSFSSVDAYIAAQPESRRPVLVKLRSIVRAAVPDAEETIGYDMPTYTLHGKRFIHFAAWRDHYALYAMNQRVQEAFKEQLLPYRVERGTIHFSWREPMPEQLIEELVRFRASLET